MVGLGGPDDVQMSVRTMMWKGKRRNIGDEDLACTRHSQCTTEEEESDLLSSVLHSLDSSITLLSTCHRYPPLTICSLPALCYCHTHLLLYRKKLAEGKKRLRQITDKGWKFVASTECNETWRGGTIKLLLMMRINSEN